MVLTIHLTFHLATAMTTYPELANVSRKQRGFFIRNWMPSLWEARAEEYSNRNGRTMQYCWGDTDTRPNATLQDVKKLHSPRTNFRKELKIRDSKKNGAGSGEVYESTLCHFQEMLFLRDQKIPAESINTIDDNEDSYFTNAS